MRLKAPGAPRPWRVWHNVGGGDFHQIGQQYFEWFREGAHLTPSAHVLDMGCGAGRLAFPLAQYLGSKGGYTGFDLSERALGFARRHVRGPARFTFIKADVQSREYGGAGSKASGYRFPVEDDSIDAALAISLFSHLLPEDAAAYLKEAGRVLKPGGRLCLTGFLVDPRMSLDDAVLSLKPFRDGAWAADPREPERAIGYEQSAFEAWLDRAGLYFAEPVEAGHWSGPTRVGEFQDRIIVEKPVV
ncbi:class I SAM-dependent methyltransferase [Oceanicaulis sp. MMSF_3324]|uniref:class I SAM-dependent methyltransferase n=1 Tax=Oceanicaulis sp. MMSF_3324 TaxID=3046702 RepID=UPI00273D2248|nr:class I SAM-dependent methyltransferase [Oceanicaulis sp. MMSF_3324]